MRNLLLLHKTIFFLLILGGFACERPPTFPKEPHIEFREVSHIFKTKDGILTDSVIINLKFEDGDGDLGLTNADADKPPFKGNADNYFIDGFIKKNGVYEPIEEYTGQSFRFPPLAPDGRIGPLEGNLKFGIPFNQSSVGSFIKKGTLLKFKIRIRDRSFNESNTVETSEIVMFTP